MILGFFSSDKKALIVLKKILKSDLINFIFVVSQPDKPFSRKKILKSTPVAEFAEKEGLTCLKFHQLDNLAISKIKKQNPDIILIAYYGLKFPKKLIDLPKNGCLNIHPSLLPKHRGASPVRWSILLGEKEAGVTIIKINENWDEGEILAQKKEKIFDDDNQETLCQRLFEIGADLFLQILTDYLAGRLKTRKQNPGKATYERKITKKDARIDWSKSDQEIERAIRAFYPWPIAWTVFQENSEEKRLKILKAHLDNNGKLEIDQVQIEGKKPISFADFLRGHPCPVFL